MVFSCLSFLVLYCGGGLLFNYCRSSICLPIHASYWREFFSLVRDGLRFSRDLLCCSKFSSKTKFKSKYMSDLGAYAIIASDTEETLSGAM